MTIDPIKSQESNMSLLWRATEFGAIHARQSFRETQTNPSGQDKHKIQHPYLK